MKLIDFIENIEIAKAAIQSYNLHDAIEKKANEKKINLILENCERNIKEYIKKCVETETPKRKNKDIPDDIFK